MPFMTNGKRDYKKQYEKYDGKDSVKKDRAKRNGARRMLEEEGKVSKGDGKDVDHKKPLSKGGGNGKSNLRVTSKSSNRSFPRKKNGAMK
jgi:5-methylcytosine-specific restriction endonuclease McrA